MNISIEKMTIDDKIKAMEALWTDICRDLPDFSSPKWHGNILKEREENLKKGNDHFIDWDKVKKDIWTELK